MLDEIKVEVKASLIFQFLEDEERPKELQILGSKKEIQNNLKELSFELTDFSINEYKIYECLFFYESNRKSHSISVYYNRNNYYLVGKGEYSIEIIFCDFIYKQINAKNCFIEYKKKKYEPKENYELSTRKRLNLLGIDITDLKLPNNLDEKEIQIKPEFGYDLLITVSVSNVPKIIGIYKNTPFSEPKIVIKKELLEELKNIIENASKPLNFEKNKTYLQYIDEIDRKNLSQYENAVKNSYQYEKKLFEYFNIYKEQLNELEIELYDLYSEFMILFPDIEGVERNSDKIILKRYWDQYYFSKLAIVNFCSLIPEYVSKSDKVKLKYAACRSLKILLYNGKGLCVSKLFNFIDFNIKETIYYEANEFNKKFVKLLKEKSEIFLFFLQNNSGSGINLLTGKNTARLSMLDENDIKSHLESTIPKYGITMNYIGCFNACTINEVRITCINISSALCLSLNSEISLKDDEVCNKRYVLANLLQHEDFGHIKFSINFYAFYDYNAERDNVIDPKSPIEYYDTKIKEGFIEITKKIQNNGKIKIVGDSGIALSSFLTRGNLNLMLLLKSDGINFIELFKNPSLMAAEDLSEFIDKLKSLNTKGFKFNPNEINLGIRYDDLYQSQGIPIGFPTQERID